MYNSIRFVGYPCWQNLLAVDYSMRIEKSPKAKLTIGRKFRARRNVELNIRDHAQMIIGNNVFFNSGCILTARENISIGDNTIFGPNVIVYDHNHQIVEQKVQGNAYTCESVCIGNNVWIGAGVIILKGAVIGDNCVIAAGSVVKGTIPSGSTLIQKRKNTVLPIQ